MIIISPYSNKLKNGNNNAKNYPYWQELVYIIRAYLNKPEIIQVGISGEKELLGITEFVPNKPLANIAYNMRMAEAVLSVDNFLPHLGHLYNIKTVVIFGQSDPLLFGYHENLNILKDRKYLRPNQFDNWDGCPFIEEAFPSEHEVFKQIKHLL